MHTAQSGAASIVLKKSSSKVVGLVIIGKDLKSANGSILFHRKTERKITFKQFEDALKLLAEKKYGSTSDVGKLEGVILKTEGPKTSGATVSFREFLYGDVLKNK